MYKEAAQLKLRFPFRGTSSVEDLFDLNLTQLDSLYKALKGVRKLEEGLLSSPTDEDRILDLQLALVKDVFETKQAESDARKAAAERKAQKERIMEIIATKQDEALLGKSLEELQGMIDEL